MLLKEIDLIRFSGSLNVDGKVVPPPSQKVIASSKNFLQRIAPEMLRCLSFQGIDCTPHGTVVFDWYKNKSFLSVEIGEDTMGFYYDLPDGTTQTRTGLPIDVENQEMLAAFRVVWHLF